MQRPSAHAPAIPDTRLSIACTEEGQTQVPDPLPATVAIANIYQGDPALDQVLGQVVLDPNGDIRSTYDLARTQLQNGVLQLSLKGVNGPKTNVEFDADADKNGVLGPLNCLTN